MNTQSKSNPETLVKSSGFRGVNGIAWGPDNLIWMGSVWSGTLVAVDPETGNIQHRVDAAKGPDDLAFHPDGRLFWNDIAFGEIGCRKPDGETNISATIEPGNNGIAFSPDGRLFVSQLFLGTKLYELDPDGKRAPRVVTDLGKNASNGMNVGPDGMLYGSGNLADNVIRIDVETGKREVVATGVGVPSSVKFNHKGELHVLDDAGGTVSKIDIKSGKTELVANLPWPGLDNMCFSPDDRLFVSSAADGYLWEITGKDTQRVVIEGGLGWPGGVVLAEAQGRTNLVVVDTFAIRKFDPDTGEAISAVRDVTMATDVGWMLTVSNHGKQLVTTSWTGNFIKLWDPENNGMVTNFDQFKAPLNAISLSDDIVFSDAAGSITRFSPDNPSDSTSLAKNLKQPFGLAYAEGNLYVSEQGAGRIIQVLEDGKVIKPHVVKDGLDAPQGLAISNGQLFVVESGAGKLLAIDLANGNLRSLAEGMEFSVEPPVFQDMKTWASASVAVTGSTAYVTGTDTAVIYKVTF